MSLPASLVTAEKPTGQQKKCLKLFQSKGNRDVSYNDIPMVADKYAAANTVDLLAKENFKLYQMSDWDFLDRDGNVLARVTDRPVYEATMLNTPTWVAISQPHRYESST